MNSFNPREIFDLIIESKVSIISLVPTMLISILEIFEKRGNESSEFFQFYTLWRSKKFQRNLSLEQKSQIPKYYLHMV